MTKRTRRILFLTLLILFLLVGPLTIFYSLGWRFDWETKTIIQPGAFFFKVWPRSCEICLNNKLKKKTDFFFGSVLIENLLSKKYEVEIKKQGFHSWEKTLEIKKREVTEAKNIVLIPENPKFTSLAKKVKNYFFSPDEKKIILKDYNPSTTHTPPLSETPSTPEVNSWSLKLLELDKNVKSHLIEEKDISKTEVHPVRDSENSGETQTRGISNGVQLISLEFSPDSKKVLLELGLKESLDPVRGYKDKKETQSPQTSNGVEYYLLEIDNVPPILTHLYFLPPQTEQVYFHPKNPQKLLIQKKGTLSETDLLSKETSLPLLENIVTLSFFNNELFYLDTSGFLLKTDLSFNRKEKLNLIPLSLKEETEYRIAVSPKHIALKEANTLYLFNKDKKTFEKISDWVKDFKFSSDFKKLAYFNNYEIWVLFLEKITDSPQKEAGDKVFLTRFSEKINNLFWFTNHYLIFNIEDKVKVAEIDDRDRINIVDLIEFKTPEIFWSKINKKLYILAEENLHESEKLTP